MAKGDNCVKIIKVNWNIKVSKQNNLEKIAQTRSTNETFHDNYVHVYLKNK